MICLTTTLCHCLYQYPHRTVAFQSRWLVVWIGVFELASVRVIQITPNPLVARNPFRPFDVNHSEEWFYLVLECD